MSRGGPDSRDSIGDRPESCAETDSNAQSSRTSTGDVPVAGPGESEGLLPGRRRWCGVVGIAGEDEPVEGQGCEVIERGAPGVGAFGGVVVVQQQGEAATRVPLNPCALISSAVLAVSRNDPLRTSFTNSTNLKPATVYSPVNAASQFK